MWFLQLITLQMLADLKANNPQIEDEIAEIEGKLSGTPVEPPA